jgi:hypothetical protein
MSAKSLCYFAVLGLREKGVLEGDGAELLLIHQPLAMRGVKKRCVPVGFKAAGCWR